MAKTKLGPGLHQLSGAIGKWVFKQTEHGTVVTPKPETPKAWSQKQTLHRRRMEIGATKFYYAQKRDPVRFAYYQARAKEKKIPVSAFLMGGYMKHGEKFAELESPDSGRRKSRARLGKPAIAVEVLVEQALRLPAVDRIALMQRLLASLVRPRRGLAPRRLHQAKK